MEHGEPKSTEFTEMKLADSIRTAGQKNVVPPHLESITQRIIGCAIEVHRALGPGLLENIYEHALMYELRVAGMHCEAQVEFRIPYKQTILPTQRLDLVVDHLIVIELKSVESVHDIHKAQLLSYLRLTDMPIGLVLNFGQLVLKDGLKRLINERSPHLRDLRVSPSSPC